MKILIVTGRTGGHFFPAKTFASALGRAVPAAEIHYVLSQRTAGNLLEEELEHSERVHTLPSFPWKGLRGLRFFKFLASLSRAFLLSRKLLARLRPNLVVGFGSYLAFPVMLMARIRNIPTLIHEQNARMGKANRVLLRFVTRVAVSFSDTLDERFPKKFVHTGNILRPELFTWARTKRESADGLFRILILGGSQGASDLNQLVTEAFLDLKPEILGRIQITHLSGSLDYDWVREKYKKLGARARVEAFLGEMGELYQESDLVISRSGAGTLFELVLFQLPAILVPYPYAGSHQYANAEALAGGGNAWILDSRTQGAEDLRRRLEELIRSPEKIEHARSRLRHILKIDDGENLARVAVELVNGRSKVTQEVSSENAR